MEDKNTIHCVIQGHPVTLHFAEEPKPNLARTIRNMLLDSFIAQNGGQLLANNMQQSPK